MRIILFLASLIVPACGFLFYMFFDYTMANRMAPPGEKIGFGSYVAGWAGLIEIGGLPGGGSGGGDLAAMLPRAPDGWTRRDPAEGDAAGAAGVGFSDDEARLARDAFTVDGGAKLTQARQIYETPKGLVAVELVRFPDFIFTSFAATQIRLQLEMAAMDIPGDDYMTVRGMPLREARLPGDSPSRVFFGDLQAQIHLRITAPAATGDEEMRALLSTLDVAAMNASLVRPVRGMGEVPVLVMVPEIDEGIRARRAEERALLEAERAAEWEAMRAERDAKAEAEAEAWLAGEQTEEKNGVTIRRGIQKNDPGRSTFATGGKAGIGTGDCQQSGSGKSCGVAPGEEAQEEGTGD